MYDVDKDPLHIDLEVGAPSARAPDQTRVVPRHPFRKVTFPFICKGGNDHLHVDLEIGAPSTRAPAQTRVVP